jgi:hypothetical protein
MTDLNGAPGDVVVDFLSLEEQNIIYEVLGQDILTYNESVLISKAFKQGKLESWFLIKDEWSKPVLKVLINVLKRGDDICDEWGRTNTVLKLQRIYQDKKHMFI